MTGKGTITHAPNRRLRLVMSLQVLWLALVCGLGAWWARFGLQQAERITELERKLGLGTEADSQWIRTSRMLFWESSTFFVLLLATTAVLWWVYLRDMKRVRSLQAFFASVTHELRTPLTSIRLQAETIAEGDPDPSLVRRLMEDTLRLESQVERTLELARVEGGGSVFLQPIALRPWLDRSLKTWREAHDDSIEIHSEIEDVTVQADVSALQVILRNLLENSLRHSGREKLEVKLNTRREPGAVWLRFEDNGDGFQGRPENLGGLFHKGAASHGAGVGLYLVRMLMERMGGKADFQASPHFGVSLRFREGGGASGG